MNEVFDAKIDKLTRRMGKRGIPIQSWLTRPIEQTLTTVSESFDGEFMLGAAEPSHDGEGNPQGIRLTLSSRRCPLPVDMLMNGRDRCRGALLLVLVDHLPMNRLSNILKGVNVGQTDSPK